MLIDVHVHTFPDHLAARTLAKLAENANHIVAPVSDGTAAALLRQMRDAAVDRAVLCPIATKPEHFAVILKDACALRDGALGNEAARALIPLASVHPADDARFAHLRAIADAGLRGIKLHPYYQACVLDAPEMLEFFRCCRDLDLIVQCHCGFDIGFPRDPLCGPERVARVAREVPGLKFIAAHLGGWRQWGGAIEHLLGKDIYLDTSILRPDADNPDVTRLLREHPFEKLLYATDWPWLSFAEGVAFVRKAGLPPEQEQAILGGNAAALFGLAPSHAPHR